MVDEPIFAPRSRLKEALQEAQDVFEQYYDEHAYKLEYADYTYEDEQFNFSFEVVPREPRLIADRFEFQANGTDTVIVRYVDATENAPDYVTFSVNSKEVEKSHDTTTSLEIVTNHVGEIEITVLENEDAGMLVLRAT